MRVTILGSGFAVPSPDRAQTGILVEAGDDRILIDCGSGVLQRLAQSGYAVTGVTHVLFTHHHLDHDGDFMSLLKAMWLLGKRKIDVLGPAGTGEWLARLMEAYPYMRGRLDLNIRSLKDRARVSIGGTLLEARRSKHALDGLAYRVKAGGTSAVFSGDTAPCVGVRELCEKETDLLIHECSFPDAEGEIFPDHTTPRGLGELVKGLPVRKLVLTHFSPVAEGRLEEMASVIRGYFKGEVILAQDLMVLEL
jgi:ribonuclease BN (tRNA processing enzyme)